MNTQSKEALEASSAIVRSLGITDEDRDLLAAIIDRHFAPLRQRAEQAEARVKELEAACAELVTDGNAVALAANLARQSKRVKELEAENARYVEAINKSESVAERGNLVGELHASAPPTTPPARSRSHDILP